ncbi:hypothetical protein [Chryseobacterium gwangjuense]|uniref:hypothetical protein n=1 Tax=Chryseobacterium gwangjuense TaxID=1069980 RepID=UPI001E4876EE|nr:hypothetical protein [Chryseobacterium gwangjuense]MCE3075334.1 hypothetical protein [Chryseobacterium gwangjuense]
MSDIGKIIRVNALPPPDKRENNVIYQVAAPGAATYKDYAIDANGDLKTPSYIPLTGTVEGKPLTKNIEVDPNQEGAVGFISNTPDLSKVALTIQEDGSVLAESRKDTDNISSSIHLHHDTGIEITATTSNNQFSAIIDTSGLQGDNYIPPSSDEHYVQKKYITDNFTSQANLNSTLADYYTSAQTDDLFYDKTEVDAKLSAVYRPKGSVANFASLPSSGNTEGDVWNIIDSGSNYVWVLNLNNTGAPGWDKLSETIDLTAYYTQNQIDATLTNYIDANGNYNIFGKKWFKTDGGNTWDNNTARIQGVNGYDAGLTFFRSGIDVGQIIFDGYRFNFTNDNNSGGFKQIKTEGYIKNGSDSNHLLTGDGGHKAISDFVLDADLNNYWQIFNHPTSDYKGVNAGQPFSILSGNSAEKLYSGGVLTSDNYSDGIYIPEHGGYFKGVISGSKGIVKPQGTGFGLQNIRQNPTHYSYWGAITGSIVILLPNAFPLHQTKIKLRIVDNQFYQHFQHIEVSTYLSAGTDPIYNSAIITNDTSGAPNIANRIRIGTTPSGKGCIVINATNTAWSYPQLMVDEVITGDYDTALLDWSTYIVTDLTGYALSDLGLTTAINSSSVINVDLTDGINNGSNIRTNKTWFDYDWAGTGKRGSVINFSGLAGLYSTELFAEYDAGGDYIGVRTKNGDLGGVWNSTRELYHTGNFNPDNYIPKTHPVYNVSQYYLDGWYGYKPYEDNRGIAPNHLGPHSVQHGFGSWDNNNNAPYADYLHFGGYSDGSGGNQNLIMFNKNSFGLRQYHGTSQGMSPYSSYVDYWHTGNLPNPATQSDLNNYVPIAGNTAIQGLKRFTGAYTQWALNDDGTTNANGFIQSDPASFNIGTLNNKNVAFYRNSSIKVLIEDNQTSFAHNVQADTWVASSEIAIGQKAGALRITKQTPDIIGGLSESNGWAYFKGTGFIADGGTSSQFLKADGTLDNNTYALSSSLGNYILKSGDTLTGGGIIQDNGNITLQQTGIGGNATGLFWFKMDDSERSSGIGTFTQDGEVQYLYMGWSNAPWDVYTSLSVSDSFLKYKNNDIWHAGNFNPSNYIPYTGATANIDINSKNFTTTGLISGFEYQGNIFASTVMAGNQVFNANNANALIFGNDIVPSLYYGALSNHNWYVNGNQVGYMTASGLGILGNVSATTGFIGATFSSGALAGNTIINSDTTQIFFGNNSVTNTYYSTGNSHIFNVNGSQIAFINANGLGVTGNLQLNGYNVITEAQRGAANGVAPLGTDSKISSAYLPSYVDDVLEFANLTAFPATGESGKIYVALDTNLTYRWGGSSYILISSGAVQSVNGQTGIVNLSKTDIGLANADNTSDATKNVLSATKWTTPRTLSYTGDVTGSASVDGSGNVGFAMTLANSGVSAGTYNSVNVDAKGRVLSGNTINYVTESYLATFLQQNYFNQTASDERFVNANGDEAINGNKTFTSSPSIPAAINGDHAVNLEQLTSSLSNVVRDNDDFEILEIYRLIDSNPFDLDDTRIKKYNIVFEGASNGSVNITHLKDNQYYQFSNVSGGADLRINVEGYGAVDAVSPGKTAVYMSWGGGKLLKISENDNVSII